MSKYGSRSAGAGSAGHRKWVKQWRQAKKIRDTQSAARRRERTDKRRRLVNLAFLGLVGAALAGAWWARAGFPGWPR